MVLITRSFKVDESVWERLKAEAAEQSTTAGSMLRDVLGTYLDPDEPCLSCAENFEVLGSTGLPVAPVDPPWDGEAAKNRVWDLCTNEAGVVDVECVSRAFLWRTPGEDPTIRESYKLGFADVIDGRLQIVPSGVYTAAGGHGVNSADIPETDKERIKRKLCTIYEKIEDAPPCPFDREGDPSPTRSGEIGTFTLTGSTDLPIADRNTMWDGPGAARRVFEHCTTDDDVDTECVSRAFLYRDPDADPTTQSAYSLGYADVIDGELKIVPRGVAATAGGRGVDATKGISADDKAAIKRKINTLYGKVRSTYEDWPPNPFPDAEEQTVETTTLGMMPDTDEPCSCEEDDEDYHADCVCEEEPDDGLPTERQTAAILGTGALHTRSKDPATRAAVQRVTELLEDGAVGVSVAMDMDPDTMPDPDELQAAFEAEDFDQIDALMADVKQRLRHLAIVDTAAFSDCRMTMTPDGKITGPMTYEGIWTGDARFTPFESITWETTLPIPIIWDREEGDHTGMTIGSITEVERVPDEVASPSTNPEAVAAAASTSLLDNVPAAYFAPRPVTPDTPFTIAAPDTRGLRAVYGLAAPKGVCHRSGDGSHCFQYPGDVDPAKMRGFHTGTALTLDDGTTVRVGAITLGGMHIDTSLAKRGVGLHDVQRHREDANQVFALVRAYETPAGLAVAGVVVPGVTDRQLAQARACAPSVELWPSGRGRTLAGIHLVPSPAWPVAASTGSAMEMASSATVVMENPPAPVAASAEPDRLTAIEASLARMEKALALLASEVITDVPLPEE